MRGMTLPRTQSQYQLHKQAQGYRLELVNDVPVRAPGANEVVLKVGATSINRRDVMIRRGFYPTGDRDRVVPLSDGAGEVVATGAAVTRFKEGDRAAAIFFQNWWQGRPTATTGASALGGAIDGMLSQYVTLDENGLVPVPASLSLEEAATLPCAAVTAWNGLVSRGEMRKGDRVLLLGTGGVSVFGLQFAVAAGAQAFITSSSDDKLERALKLGAAGTLNYVTTPEWADSIRQMSQGGIEQVLEVGGTNTLPQSLAVLAPGGHIAIIGGLSGFGGQIPAASLIANATAISGIFVGSRAHFEAMNAFIETHRIKPVIDAVIDYANADDAYALMESSRHFGKIVIRH